VIRVTSWYFEYLEILSGGILVFLALIFDSYLDHLLDTMNLLIY